MTQQKQSGGWLGGFVLFASVVAVILLAQIPPIGAALEWLFTHVVGLLLAGYVLVMALFGLAAFGQWFARNPILALLKLVFWPIAGLLLLFQKAN